MRSWLMLCVSSFKADEQAPRHARAAVMEVVGDFSHRRWNAAGTRDLRLDEQ
jgi:hypothetical protein